MGRCPLCGGTGVTACIVCLGIKTKGETSEKICRYCQGYGEIRCVICGGKKDFSWDEDAIPREVLWEALMPATQSTEEGGATKLS